MRRRGVRRASLSHHQPVPGKTGTEFGGSAASPRPVPAGQPGRSGTSVSEERLQKIMAAAGVGSRRACEDLIDRGRVTVNGKRAHLGDKADAETAVIHVDGQRIV